MTACPSDVPLIAVGFVVGRGREATVTSRRFVTALPFEICQVRAHETDKRAKTAPATRCLAVSSVKAAPKSLAKR